MAKRSEKRKRNDFVKAANYITFLNAVKARAAKAAAEPRKPAEPAKAFKKDPAEKLKEDAAILQGLARAHLKLQGSTLSEGVNGRDVRLTGKASTGLAVIACASLLQIDATAAHAESKIRLIRETKDDFSEASEKAIKDTIKALHSPVQVILKPTASAEEIVLQRNSSKPARKSSVKIIH